jgi:hypothetical protein
MRQVDIHDVHQCIRAMVDLDGFMTENSESGKHYVKIAFPSAKQMHDFVDGLRGLRAWADEISVVSKAPDTHKVNG